MGSGSEFDTPDQRLTSLYIGTVVERVDPERLGRIKANVPGVIEPESAWCFPLGTNGGGSFGTGSFAVPKVGAEVGIFFKEGDPDTPWYMSANWGIPEAGENAGKNEVPVTVRNTSDPARACNIIEQETRFFRITIDENDRDGNFGETLEIIDKNSGDGITIDRNLTSGPQILIKGSAGVLIESDGIVKLKATEIQFNDRIVLPGNQPI